MTREKIFKWIFEAIAILSMLVMIGGYFVLRSSGFHHFVLAKIEQQAEEATGGRVEIKNYVFHFSKLSADVYGIVIYGTEKDPNYPLLALDQLSIDLKIISVLHQKVDLNEIILRHPVIRTGTAIFPNRTHQNRSKATRTYSILGLNMFCWRTAKSITTSSAPR